MNPSQTCKWLSDAKKKERTAQETLENARHHLSFLEETLFETHRQVTAIARAFLLDGIDPMVIYGRFSPILDPHGDELFLVAKHILDIPSVASKFPHEAAVGRFEQMYSKELIPWLEAAAFDEVERFAIPGDHFNEIISFNIDTASTKYIGYRKRLFSTTMRRITDKV